MAARHKTDSHYHGHIDDARMADALPQRANFHTALNGADEVVEWMARQLRSAASNPEMGLSDESRLWDELVGKQEQISTGLQGGPTIIAVPIPEDRCPCERPELRTVRGKA